MSLRRVKWFMEVHDDMIDIVEEFAKTKDDIAILRWNGRRLALRKSF